jgi:3-oxoadipate enol-lactonase
VLPGLSAARRTIRFDNRGVGQSDLPEDGWELTDMADDIVRVMDAAGVDRAHVFGVSMGGVITQELALRRPDRVRSVVLGCTHPSGRDAARMDADAAAMLMDRTPKSAREAIDASVPFIYAETTPRDVVEEDIAIRLRVPVRAKAYWGQLDAMRRHDGMLDRLRSLAIPALVIHGTADRLVKPENATRLADAIPGARLEWLPGASHVFWSDQPQRSVQLVNEFLAGLDR